ncbi:MAG TPA: RlmE family RNA methyltransferase [Spirochaetia bacterium]|nr:RlmE family RNA methyltransferase [Spirochaetales bacterium]HRW24082.1 RlmE family RNA methyltransferase [Spirochaetia bacterium]
MATGHYDKPDFWAEKARKEGYPARSVYKLDELDRKFGILRPGLRVLDIGAAPGSWSLWALKRLNGSGFLSAVDLQPLGISPSYSNFHFIRGDLYDDAVKAALAERGPYDLVLSDAAPATSGNRGLDTDRSEAIVEAVLGYADDLLKPGGSVVAKLFIGGGQRELLDRMKASYASARAFKPEACRTVSFETYLIGLGRK